MRNVHGFEMSSHKIDNVKQASSGNKEKKHRESCAQILVPGKKKEEGQTCSALCLLLLKLLYGHVLIAMLVHCPLFYCFNLPARQVSCQVLLCSASFDVVASSFQTGYMHTA